MNGQGSPEPIATFYVIRNERGEYYSTRWNRSWVKDLIDARVYAAAGPARGKITRISNENMSAPVPELVELIVREVNIVDQKDRVAQARLNKQLEIENRQKAKALWDLNEAKRALSEAQAKIEKLTKRN